VYRSLCERSHSTASRDPSSYTRQKKPGLSNSLCAVNTAANGTSLYLQAARTHRKEWSYSRKHNNWHIHLNRMLQRNRSSRDSSVSIVTRMQGWSPGLLFLTLTIFLLSTASRQDLGRTQHTLQWIMWTLSPRMKLILSPFNTELENTRSCTSTPPKP